MKDIFRSWLKNTTSLSESSCDKYASAINSISKDMINNNVISKNIYDMNIVELDLSIALIFNNSYFQDKDKTGNHMYSCSLKHFRRFLLNTLDSYDEEKKIEERIKNDININDTERVALIKSRVGQGEFRELLLERYDSKCVVTGVDIPQLLVASHIKPWRCSSNTERLSVNNGLLLSATFDRLFDSGLISFRNDGTILVSKLINYDNQRILRLDKYTKININGSNESLLQNLEYHRDKIFSSH